MAEEYVLDESLFPLILAINPQVPTLPALDAYLQRVEELYARKSRILWLSCFHKTNKNDNAVNQRLGEWVKANKSLTKGLNCGIAFHSQSRVFNFILSAIFLVQPVDAPYKSGANLADLCRFLGMQAETQQISLPSGWEKSVVAWVAAHLH